MEKTIYDLELHEKLELNGILYILRVPGGWIYVFWDSEQRGVFVPFHGEFDPKYYSK